MYEPSRLVSSFHVAGFQYWDGAMALCDLKPGDALTLVPEFDNPHDSTAVAIYSGEFKLGFVPAEQNELLAQLMFYGHADAFEVRVQQVAPDRSPWHQLRVGLYVRDAR